jgi:hypothetical protein
MIDQSNRAGKLNINGSEDLDGQNFLRESPPPTGKGYDHSKRNQGLPQNQKRLHRRTKSTKIPVTAAIVSRQSSLSYMTKGKSI